MFYFTSNLAHDLSAKQIANDNRNGRLDPLFVRETAYWVVVKSVSPWGEGHLNVLPKHSFVDALSQSEASQADLENLGRELAKDLQEIYKKPVVLFSSYVRAGVRSGIRLHMMPLDGDFYAACRFLYPDWKTASSFRKLAQTVSKDFSGAYHFLGFYLEGYECFCMRPASKNASASFFRKIHQATL